MLTLDLAQQATPTSANVNYRHWVVTIQCINTDAYTFSRPTCDALTAVVEAADDAVRKHIKPVTDIQVLIEGSTNVLETGDNAATLAPDLIRWWFDPALDVVRLASRHFAHAYAHEAFHATRFRRLPTEASARSWRDIAINEGLATSFARDTAHAEEPWSTYDADTIEAWSHELLSLDPESSTLTHWKFRHPDGR